MDLPIGEIIESKALLKDTGIKEKLALLVDSEFLGYVVVTVEGRSGIEEGAVLVYKGKIIGAVFDYLRFGKKLLGDAALQHFFNASKAGSGIVDVVVLSRQQIELIIAFNEKIELSKPVFSRDLQKLVPEKYNPALAEAFLGQKVLAKESKFEVFKKVGLAEFARK